MTELAARSSTARVTIERFGVAAEGVPALVDQVSALPLDDFVASATRTVDGIDALVRSDTAAALPGSVDAALDEARGLIADLRTGGSVENVNAALASLRQLTDELRAANLGAEIAKAGRGGRARRGQRRHRLGRPAGAHRQPAARCRAASISCRSTSSSPPPPACSTAPTPSSPPTASTEVPRGARPVARAGAPADLRAARGRRGRERQRDAGLGRPGGRRDHRGGASACRR